MIFLGIHLTTPSARTVVISSLMVTFCGAIAGAALFEGWLSRTNAASFFLACAGGVIANAYGASILKYGLRGLVVVYIFVFVVVFLGMFLLPFSE